MKKIGIFRLLAVLLLTAAVCVSCSGENNSLADFIGEEEKVDLDGFTMTYALCAATIYGDVDAKNALGFADGTIFYDLALNRIDDVEKALGCKIKLVYAEDGADVKEFNTRTLSGVFYCDVIQSTSEWLIESAKIGGLIGISDLEDINLSDSDKWGSPQLLESMCWNDDCYAVAPMSYPELCYTTFGYPIVFSPIIVSSLGLTDPREYYENGEWTWDTFKQCLKDYTVKDGSEYKYYGMAVHAPYFAEMFIRSNGSALVEYDKTKGKYVCGFYDAAGIKAVKEANNIYMNEYADCFDKANTVPEAVAKTFVEGKAVMCAVDTEHLYGLNAKISMSSSDFGMLPFPTGPDVEPGYVFSVHEALRYATSFSVLGSEPDACAKIIDALYEPLPGFETKDAIITYMMHNYFFDIRDAELFFKMFDNTYYNYFHWATRSFAEDTVTKEKSVSETMTSLSDKMQDIIDEYITPALNGAEAVWGTNWALEKAAADGG